VESSTKPIYHFNVGICRNVGTPVAIFKKRDRWELVIEPKKVVLRARRVSIHIYFGSLVEIDFGDQKVTAREDELKEYFIVPDTEIPYMKPISLYDFVEKLILYYEAAQDCW
jgi:hypothetical protein